MKLYPLKFKPILKERIWGGTKLQTVYGKDLGGKENIGESWELSSVEGDVSIVSNGELEGNSLQELIEIYMDEIVGEKVFDKFGNEFPLLIKLLDANADLSVQVHPNDELAKQKHHAYGKTEMWYVIDDHLNPTVINGFNKETNREELQSAIKNNTVTELLNVDAVKKGEVVFIPAGRIHALCKGSFVAEIQQTSDITYRVYDYDRKDKEGNTRDLHIDHALDALDFSKVELPIIKPEEKLNSPVELASCEYFTSNVIEFDTSMERDYMPIDSFVILIGIEGEIIVGEKNGKAEALNAGEVILLPSALKDVVFIPKEKPSKLLEVYIK